MNLDHDSKTEADTEHLPVNDDVLRATVFRHGDRMLFPNRPKDKPFLTPAAPESTHDR